MTAFVWDGSFVTGFADVDEQHFHLVESDSQSCWWRTPCRKRR
jgi:hypothetical protein